MIAFYMIKQQIRFNKTISKFLLHMQFVVKKFAIWWIEYKTMLLFHNTEQLHSVFTQSIIHYRLLWGYVRDQLIMNKLHFHMIFHQMIRLITFDAL